MAETRRQPFHAVYDTGEELFLGTCDSRGVGGVGVLVNTSLSININSFKELTNRIGYLRLKRCGPIPAFAIFIVYAPTSNNDEEVEAFHMDLKKLYREDHTFFENIIADFNQLSQFIMATNAFHGNSQFQKPHPQSWTSDSPSREYHNEIGHITVNKRFCLTDVAALPKFYTGSDHRLLPARIYFFAKWRKSD
uniref:Endo/exonuclease/phosphatase domain-containing protein n=1 Tax=Angiostrongylus cantonensis TaxID=6313 RepID=A0A0K0CTF2_ANGCA